MNHLPTEVIERIIQPLTLPSLITVSQVCSRFREIVARRHYNSYLSKQEFVVLKHLRAAGWSENCESVNLIVTLFWKVYKHLHQSWTDGSPTHVHSVLGIWIPGDQNSFRVTDRAVYLDKLYLALENCIVHVYDLNTMAQITTLETTTEAGVEPVMVEAIMPACKLAQHGRTLAVKNSRRNKVRMYNCDTDELVGEIVTRAGPFYNLTMNDRLLVCLSGWSCFSWRIDSDAPDTVRGRFQGVCPDFEPSDLYQNWLEVHSAVINKDYLVTRATRVLVNPSPANGRQRIFLHVRRVGPDGFLGPTLRPDNTALDSNIVKIVSMRLSDNNLLAAMVLVRQEPSRISGVVYRHRYMIQITDIVTGNLVSCLPTESILSLQIPICWRDDQLYVKIVPNPSAAFMNNDVDVDFYEVSLAKWNITSNELCHIPNVQVVKC